MCPQPGLRIREYAWLKTIDNCDHLLLTHNVNEANMSRQRQMQVPRCLEFCTRILFGFVFLSLLQRWIVVVGIIWGIKLSSKVGCLKFSDILQAIHPEWENVEGAEEHVSVNRSSIGRWNYIFACLPRPRYALINVISRELFHVVGKVHIYR